MGRITRTMDAKETHLVSELHRRIVTSTFHELDVLALLILLREHAPKNSPVRELADFVAHREKDRGSLKTYVHHVVKYGEALINGTEASLKIEVVHSAEDFRKSLNTVLGLFRLPALPRDASDGVLTCVMSLLQDVRLFHDKRELGRLGLGRFNKDLWLCATIIMPPKDVTVVFPALIIANRFCLAEEDKSREAFEGLAEAKCTRGKLQLYIDGKLVV